MAYFSLEIRLDDGSVLSVRNENIDQGQITAHLGRFVSIIPKEEMATLNITGFSSAGDRVAAIKAVREAATILGASCPQGTLKEAKEFVDYVYSRGSMTIPGKYSPALVQKAQSILNPHFVKIEYVRL